MDSYSLPSDEQLKGAYVKAYSHLRVFKDSDMEARISTLESQVTEKDRIIEVLMSNGSDKSREIENLKTQLIQLQSKINHITESRREADQIMDQLFEDPQFREFVSLKLKEFVKKNLR